MSDSMSVRVRLLDQEFVVPCAEGDQNIKWLAIAAVRLYSVMHQHNYALRQRERLVSEGGVVLPHGVRQLGATTSLDPADTINTTLEDGETVEVLVQKQIKLGRNGIPEPSEFHAKVSERASTALLLRMRRRIVSAAFWRRPMGAAQPVCCVATVVAFA
jgi:hypothetical protein